MFDEIRKQLAERGIILAEGVGQSKIDYFSFLESIQSRDQLIERIMATEQDAYAFLAECRRSGLFQMATVTSSLSRLSDPPKVLIQSFRTMDLTLSAESGSNLLTSPNSDATRFLRKGLEKNRIDSGTFEYTLEVRQFTDRVTGLELPDEG